MLYSIATQCHVYYLGMMPRICDRPLSYALLTMKAILLITATFLTSYVGAAQSTPETFAATTLQDGFPSLLEGPVKDLGLSNLRFAELETGIDTLTAFFGAANQGESSGYWWALAQNGSLLSASFGWQMDAKEGFLEASVMLNLDNERGIVLPLELRLILSANTVLYRWPTGNSSPGGKAQIQQIDKPIKVGHPMPHFSVEMLDGESVALESLLGRPAVINWWSTACAPCIAEMPGLNALVQQYRDQEDVVFLAIAWDERDVLSEFLTEREFLYDQSVYNENTVELFGESFPKHVVVDGTGVVIYYAEGGSDQAHEPIEAALLQILSQKQ